MQRDNTAGVIAGRDANIHIQEAPRRSPLAALVERYRAEAERDKNLREFIENIQLFLDPATEELVDLERKLELGQRSAEYRTALRMKESFYKKLLTHQLSPAAQEIFAHLLGFIHNRFQAVVVPLIAAGTAREEVDAVLASQVLEPTHELLVDNALSIHFQDLRGMLYYLTGSCHIKWHR